MSFNVLETDEHGNIVAKPVIGRMVTTYQGACAVAATCGFTNRRGESHT